MSYEILNALLIFSLVFDSKFKMKRSTSYELFNSFTGTSPRKSLCLNEKGSECWAMLCNYFMM